MVSSVTFLERLRTKCRSVSFGLAEKHDINKTILNIDFAHPFKTVLSEKENRNHLLPSSIK